MILSRISFRNAYNLIVFNSSVILFEAVTDGSGTAVGVVEANDGLESWDSDVG